MFVIFTNSQVAKSAVTIVSIILLFAYCTPSKQSTSESGKEEVETKSVLVTSTQGKKIYDIYCLMCHGEDGKRILTGYYDLAESKLDLQGIINVTRSGRNAMLPYQSILDEQELKAVAEYTHSLNKEAK